MAFTLAGFVTSTRQGSVRVFSSRPRPSCRERMPSHSYDLSPSVNTTLAGASGRSWAPSPSPLATRPPQTCDNSSIRRLVFTSTALVSSSVTSGVPLDTNESCSTLSSTTTPATGATTRVRERSSVARSSMVDARACASVNRPRRLVSTRFCPWSIVSALVAVSSSRRARSCSVSVMMRLALRLSSLATSRRAKSTCRWESSADVAFWASSSSISSILRAACLTSPSSRCTSSW